MSGFFAIMFTSLEDLMVRGPIGDRVHRSFFPFAALIVRIAKQGHSRPVAIVMMLKPNFF
jgi:hypothetical protein